LFSLFLSRAKSDFSGSRKSRWQCRGKRDTYTNMYIYASTRLWWTNIRGRREWYRRNYCCNVKEIHFHVYIFAISLQGAISFVGPNPYGHSNDGILLAACVHEGMVIAGRILRNSPCGNCIRQITDLQFCETIRNLQCQCCRINKSYRHQRCQLVNLSCMELNNMTRDRWDTTKFLLFQDHFTDFFIVFHIKTITENTNFYTKIITE